jgi:hypothetical protein
MIRMCFGDTYVFHLTTSDMSASSFAATRSASASSITSAAFSCTLRFTHDSHSASRSAVNAPIVDDVTTSYPEHTRHKQERTSFIYIRFGVTVKLKMLQLDPRSLNELNQNFCVCVKWAILYYRRTTWPETPHAGQNYGHCYNTTRNYSHYSPCRQTIIFLIPFNGRRRFSKSTSLTRCHVLKL